MENIVIYLVIAVILGLWLYVALVVYVNRKLRDEVNHCYKDHRNGFDKKSIRYLSSMMDLDSNKKIRKQTAVKEFMRNYDACKVPVRSKHGQLHH